VEIEDDHFELVAAEIANGVVVPFLGAGANLCDRPEKVSWEQGSFAPSGRELAKALATQSKYPNLKDLDDPARQPDLQWISQYFGAVLGDKPLYKRLREVFEARYSPSSLHRLLAGIPALLRERGAEEQLLVLTTNYDDLLTEDSYIDYLAGPAVGKQLPPSLISKMVDSHFLFLGYSMRDWNMRVILKQLWGRDKLGMTSWAVQLEQSDLAARKVEKKLWSQRGDVDLLYAPLKEYVARLGAELDAVRTP
jgi:hypothetical protein